MSWVGAKLGLEDRVIPQEVETFWNETICRRRKQAIFLVEVVGSLPSGVALYVEDAHGGS